MSETTRYTALVQGDHQKAALDMAKVLERDFSVEKFTAKPGSNSKHPVNPQPSYNQWSAKFLKRHELHLLGMASTWLLLDIAFYSLNLAQKDVYPVSKLVPRAGHMNVIEEVFNISKTMFIIALAEQVPGYWFTVFLIDKVGRFYTQLAGFFFMSVFMSVLGFRYDHLTGKKCPPKGEHEFCGGHPIALIALLSLTLFFANFRPNSNSFIVPAELFSTRFRSICDGISAGAIVGAFWVQNNTQEVKGIKTAIKALTIVNNTRFWCRKPRAGPWRKSPSRTSIMAGTASQMVQPGSRD